jgi:hypothetical protein
MVTTSFAPTDTQSFLAPPPHLLTQVTDPTTQQPTYAFPLQTTAWLKMQDVVRIALSFPLSKDTFVAKYGTFTDEGTVDTAVTILGALQQTANQYGDPLSLISQIAEFQKANIAPDSIYANAVWLAAQTQLTAQQIASLLQIGMTDIGNNPSPAERISELTELLTGQGGINSLAATLQTEIGAFQNKTSTYYQTLNTELTGDTNSLKWYLGQASNVLTDAQNAVTNDLKTIQQMKDTIETLNSEYIGFTVAASVSPVFLLIPFFGIFLAIADATTFGVLASNVKKALDQAREDLGNEEVEEQKKAALVTQLTSFNTSAQTVEVDGQAFLDAVGMLIGGWTEFQQQINLRLTSLTTDDVADWSAFLTKINFQSSLAGWNLIDTKAEAFFTAGLVQFSPQSQS